MQFFKLSEIKLKFKSKAFSNSLNHILLTNNDRNKSCIHHHVQNHCKKKKTAINHFKFRFKKHLHNIINKHRYSTFHNAVIFIQDSDKIHSLQKHAYAYSYSKVIISINLFYQCQQTNLNWLCKKHFEQNNLGKVCVL